MNNKGLEISMTIIDDPLCRRDDEVENTIMDKRLNIYDREIIDILLSTHKPFARRAADILIDKNIPLVQGYRTLTEVVIELEKIKEELEKELIEYKSRYGNIST